MKKVLFLMLFGCSAYAQENALVHINAEFNISNDWYALEQITGVKVYNGYIDTNPKMAERYDVKKVPTLILYQDGVEVHRWEAGLDMKLHVKANEVQHKIDAL